MSEEVVTIEHESPHGVIRATASHTGGQLLTCSVDGRDLLYLSPLADLRPGSPIRGGTPVCFPWFANGPGGGLRPSHGFARCFRWTLLENRTIAGAHQLRWQLLGSDIGADVAGRDLWRHSFTATCTQTFDDGVRVELTIHNTSDRMITYEGMLHSYLRVSDATEVTLDGLSGVTYLDKLAGSRPTPQDGPVRFSQPVDRIYASAEPLTLHDGDRKILISKDNSATTVVWNPGAQHPADVPPGGWRDFVCVEAGNAGASAITLAPGEQHTLGTQIRFG